MKELCPIEPYNECCDFETPSFKGLLNSCEQVHKANRAEGGLGEKKKEMMFCYFVKTVRGFAVYPSAQLHQCLNAFIRLLIQPAPDGSCIAFILTNGNVKNTEYHEPVLLRHYEMWH